MTPKDKSPTVTVVIIFLNAERFIGEAVESVLRQTFRDFELILVDDGSSDGSTDIARTYAREYPGLIRYVEHDGHVNKGMSASRNLGARSGTGRYITFLDSDDAWLPTMLERYVSEIEAHPDAGMVYGPMTYWYSWAEKLVQNSNDVLHEDYASPLLLKTNVLHPPPVVLKKFLATKGECLPGICSLILRRTAFDQVGGFEENFKTLYEDQAFMAKMTATVPVLIIKDELALYRQHLDSCCHQAIVEGSYHPEDLHPARYVYLCWLRDYCNANGLTTPDFQDFIRREIRPYESKWARRLFIVRYTIPRMLRDQIAQYLSPKLKKRLRITKFRAEAYFSQMRDSFSR